MFWSLEDKGVVSPSPFNFHSFWLWIGYLLWFQFVLGFVYLLMVICDSFTLVRHENKLVKSDNPLVRKNFNNKNLLVLKANYPFKGKLKKKIIILNFIILKIIILNFVAPCVFCLILMIVSLHFFLLFFFIWRFNNALIFLFFKRHCKKNLIFNDSFCRRKNLIFLLKLWPVVWIPTNYWNY